MPEANHISKVLEGVPHLRPNIRDYDHIELTPEEQEDAILWAKVRKARQIEELEANQKRIAKIQELIKPKEYTELKQFVLSKSRSLPFDFELDDNNNNAFRLLCLYFSNSPEFEKEGLLTKDGTIAQQYSLQKGIVLYSEQRGTGKTVLMELFAQNSKNCFVVVPTKRLAAMYQSDGVIAIERHSTPWMCIPDPRYFYQSPVGICFDDLGDEQIKNNFGNKENVMQRILQQIYDEDTQHETFKYFHATTNLRGDQIEEMYDKRVRSRMREMFNWIELKGADRRR